MRTLILSLVLLFSTFAIADSTSNAKVGIKQGAAELYVKTGGLIKVRDLSQHQVAINLVGIEGAVVGYGLAPHAGSVSSIVCTKSDAFSDTPTILTGAINGVAITNGAVTITSAGAQYADFTATPTAANTVANYDLLTLTSNGGTNTTANSSCIVFVTP